MTVTLSVDHRAIDGALAAEFVSIFKTVVEDPLSLML
jgi:pyruvate dehydrogenase E2 component (dihydrolipoamide acetyltransferase)